MYKLNNRFSLSSDQWNWILIEGLNSNNPIRRYYANLKQLSQALLDIVAKDTLTSQCINEYNNTPTSARIDLVMGNITKDLEVFLKGVVNNEKSSKN